MAKRKTNSDSDAATAWTELCEAEQIRALETWETLFEAIQKDYPDHEHTVSISQNRYDALREAACFGIGLAAAFGKHHRKLIRDLETRIKALERGEVLGAKYLGIWQRQQSYTAGNLATFRGSLWHCNVASTGCEPGDGKIWTLAAKGEQPVKASREISR